MDFDLYNIGAELDSIIQQNQPAQAEALLSRISREFTEYELLQSSVDSYILVIFNKSNGLLNFISKVIHKTEFKKAKILCFELLYTIVNNCTRKVQQHFEDIINASASLVRSSASPHEKRGALKLITLILDRGNLHQLNMDKAITHLFDHTLNRCLFTKVCKSLTVEEELLSTVGVLIKKYPTTVLKPIELRSWLLNHLNNELFKPNKSYPVITGYLRAISDCLFNFPLNINDTKSINTLYKCVKILSDPGDAHRRVVFRESLGLITKHMSLLSCFIYSEAKLWHSTLLKWLDLGKEDKYTAYKTLDAFYREIANELSNRNEESDKEIFEFFMEYFRNSLFKTSSEDFEKLLTIRGLGSFAKAFRNHLDNREINKMFIMFSQTVENTYILNQKEQTDDDITCLPHYIQALSFIIKNLPHLSNSNVTCLEQTSVLMIKLFPKISPSQHNVIVEAFILCCFQLTQCDNNTLEVFLENVLYQGVIWTCSHEFTRSEDRDTTTVKDFLPFWNRILTITTAGSYGNYEIYINDRKLLVGKFVNKLVEVLFTLIDKLDVNIKLKDQNDTVTDPRSAYEPVRAHDFIIFLNVVEFYQNIFVNFEEDSFEKWIPKFFDKILYKSLKHPLVSGFYKLFGSCLKVCDNLNYFSKSNLIKDEEIKICYDSVVRFIQNILHKVQQYSEDLQLAYLEVIINAPTCLIYDLVEDLTSTLVILFTVGRSYLELADKGIDTLNRWLKSFPQQVMERILKKVLPCLDSYLQSRSLDGTSDVITQQIRSRKTAQALAKRKMLVKIEPELFKLQIKILTFLGKLDDNLCLALVNASDTVEPVVWNKTQYLKITLPYNDAKLNVYLDKFIPRITELALYSSDRRVRMVACELLHGVVMLMLGTSHSMNPDKLKDLNYMMKAIAPAIIRLGCDTDQVVQQLYFLLMKQLMHYYSHPRQMGSSHAEIIVETLIDAVTNPTSASLRDFAGTCIKEFVVWTVKQCNPNELKRNPINIKLWITTIRTLSIHPDSYKKLGAALIFNNIYTVLREEVDMFNMFWIEILYAFVTCLSQIDERNIDEGGCVNQILRALDRLQRGFVEKHQNFNDENSIRRKPFEFQDTLLKDVALYLLKQSSSLNIYCRQKCAKMFCKIASLVSNCNGTTEKFIQLHVTDNEWIASTYEKDLQKYSKNFDVITSNDEVFKYLKSLLCCVEGYIFVIKNNLIRIGFTSKASSFLTSLKLYLQRIQTKDMVDVLSSISQNKNIICTAFDNETYENLKSDINIKIIEFLNVTMENVACLTYFKLTPENVWEMDFWSLICFLIFEYAPSLGTDLENEFHNLIFNLLDYLSNCAPPVIDSFKKALMAYVSSKMTTMDYDISSPVSVKHKFLIKGMLLIHNSAMCNKLPAIPYFKDVMKNLSEILLKKENETTFLMKPHANRYEFYELLLEMAFNNMQEVYALFTFLNGYTMVIDSDEDREIQFEIYFFNTFKNPIVKCLCTHFKIFMQRFEAENADRTINYILEILRYISHNNRKIDPTTILELVNISLNNWQKLLNGFNNTIRHKQIGIEFVNSLNRISIEPLYLQAQEKTEIVNWYIELLNIQAPYWSKEELTNFKCEVLNVLPCLIGSATLYDEKLRQTMLSLKDEHFSDPRTFTSTTSLTIFKKLFNAAKNSKSNVLLSSAMDIYIRVFRNLEEIDINSGLETFIRYTTVENQKNTLLSIHEMCFNLELFSHEQRYGLAKNVMTVLLRKCYYTAFEEFYIEIIKDLLSELARNKNSSHFDVTVIVNKTIMYILVELLFFRIKTEHFDNKCCPITKAGFPESTPEKQLLKTLIAYSLEVCKEAYPDLSTKEEKTALRLYYCHSYNALISLISNTQKDIMLYNKFLFSRENSNRQDILWKNLINLEEKYSFPIEFESNPSFKKMLISVRNDVRQYKKTMNPATQTAKYVESQNLFQSTLSEDVTKFDFSYSILRDQTNSKNLVNGEHTEDHHIKLENIDLNKHECMATICGLIQFMVDENISSLPSENENISLPKWMKSIYTILMTETTSENVKIFLTKVIYNCQHIFKPYAKWFSIPIMYVIIEGCLGFTINYFVADIVLMLTNWSKVAIPDSNSQVVARYLGFFMKNINSDRRDVLKNNLYLIQLIVETWKTCLEVPYDVIRQKLALETDNKHLHVGIELTGILLANNIAPWHPDDVKVFIKTLCKGLKSAHRTVYRPCSEVLGMTLKFMDNNPNCECYKNDFKEYLSGLLSKLESSDDKFAYCLEGLTLHYPSIADKYLYRLASKLYSVHGDFRAIYLKIFITRAELLESLKVTSALDFQKLLSDDKVAIQTLTLELIEKSVEHLQLVTMEILLEIISKFITSPSNECRTKMYNMCIAIYKKFVLEQHTGKIVEMCKNILLQGLVDKDAVVQETILTFWSDPDNLPENISQQFLFILNKMYDANIEEHYIAYSTYLLLHKVKSKEEFNEQLFEHALYECDYEEYRLISNWKKQHLSMAPLFADSLSSQENSVHLMNPNVLRATATTLQFEPTQVPSTSSTSRNYYHSSSTSSSLLFSQNNTDDNFKDPNVFLSVKPTTRGVRFLKDKTKISKYFAHLGARKAYDKETVRKEKAKEKERNVVVLRNYRFGDFPDVEIKLSAIITPLQALVRWDAQLARTLYASLFVTLIGKLKSNRQQNVEEYIQNINKAVNNIFEASTQYCPNTIGTFLDIALTKECNLRFDPNVVATICQSSGLLSLGSLLLENSLIEDSDTNMNTAKRRKGVESDTTLPWIKLALMYKEMEEWDVVRAIFLEKIDSSEAVLNAIEAESIGHWRSAQEFYTQVINEDPSLDRKDFYYESYFKCMASLGEWQKLPEFLEVVTGADDTNLWSCLWNDKWNQQKLLPWYITAELRNMLNGSDSRLMSFINNSLTNPENFEYLKSNFGEELAMLFIVQNDIHNAEQYVNSSLTLFLDTWPQLNPLLVKLRAKNILNLQRLTDIFEFCYVINKMKIENYKNMVDTTLQSWCTVTGNKADSLILNETKVVYRNQFITAINTKIQVDFKDEIKPKKLKNCKFNLYMNLIENAIYQENYYVAKKYIKTVNKLTPQRKVDIIRRSLGVSEFILLNSQIEQDKNKKISLLMESLRTLDATKPTTAEDDLMCYNIKTEMHLYNVANTLYEVISNSKLFDENQEALRDLIHNFTINQTSDIKDYGTVRLKDSVEFCENKIDEMMNQENLKIYEHLANAYVKLAYGAQNKGDEFDNELILYILKATKHGSEEGRQMFPCLLEKDIGIKHKDIFINECLQIPIWMFLKWLPQLLANLDTSCVFAISDILIKIAEMYPQAITYPYRLSKRTYKIKADAVGNKSREVIKRLDELLLSDLLIETFLKAIACVSDPKNILGHYIKKLIQSCQSKPLFLETCQKVLKAVYNQDSDTKDINKTQGIVFKKIKIYQNKLQSLCKGKFDVNGHQNLLKIMLNELKGLSVKSTKLVEYSPWLAHFQSSDYQSTLELPGQYTGDRQPLVQYHVKIMGFAQNVQILSSMRNPIKITILGNDAKEYSYLIKFGEDLRQDQRIEQIFGLMNGILSQDVNSNRRQLNIRTYQVIPLTSEIGIIEWVNDTIQLQTFIESNISTLEEKNKYNNSANEYYLWMSKVVPRHYLNDTKQIYGHACLKYSRDNTIAKYRSLVNNLSMDILRKSFWNISVNSESFFALRQKFGTSYAVVCITQWLLGIGDRHLQNSLLDVRTGEVIGIDFGLAFGTGTQIQPIPELVPFRLTPHILHLFEPLNEHGLLQETMIHCLRAYRKKKDVLLATMNVFIKEPSLDWLEYARRSEQTSGYTISAEWYPSQKITHAERKLNGANPTSIMIEELQAGHSNYPQFLSAYISVVKGTPSYNFRATKDDNLVEEDQVKCLLDHATDYNLLGRMYDGWRPWI